MAQISVKTNPESGSVLGGNQHIAQCLTVIAAFLAINTWKHQSKAQKQSDFLDELTDVVHEYMQALSRPRTHLMFLRTGFDSYRNTLNTHDGTLQEGAKAYIQAHGEDDAKKMWDYLEPSAKLVSKINALIARGQVYGFTQYDQARSSIEMLTWQHQRLQVVASAVGGASLNWENELVKGMIENMLSVTPEDIAKHQEEHGTRFLEFVNSNYKRIYAGT